MKLDLDTFRSIKLSDIEKQTIYNNIMKDLNEFANLPDEEKEAVLRDVIGKVNQDQKEMVHEVDMFIDLKDEDLPYLDIPTALFTAFIGFATTIGLFAIVAFIFSLFK
jgi:hypothetical protein